jgi:predicted S18 family serine protease
VKAARDNVVSSSKTLEEAITKAEETTRTARKAVRAAMKVFGEVAASSEKMAPPAAEPDDTATRQFADAMSRLETEDSRLKPQPRDNRPDIHSRLQFLAKMYATDKDQPFSKTDSLEDE